MKQEVQREVCKDPSQPMCVHFYSNNWRVEHAPGSKQQITCVHITNHYSWGADGMCECIYWVAKSTFLWQQSHAPGSKQQSTRVPRTNHYSWWYVWMYIFGGKKHIIHLPSLLHCITNDPPTASTEGMNTHNNIHTIYHHTLYIHTNIQQHLFYPSTSHKQEGRLKKNYYVA